MADLTTKYLGMELKNPIIVGASGLTANRMGVRKCEEAGAAAVVMNSVFEEQINHELNALKSSSYEIHPEWQDYLNVYGTENSLKGYLDEIKSAKKAVSIPVIGSLNCVSKGDWVQYAKRIEDTGVDALELNVFVVPRDIERSSPEIEREYVEIYKKVDEQLEIPVALKIPPYLTTPGRFIKSLDDEDVEGLVLFNRPLPFDINIEKRKVVVGNIISAPQEISYALRMISIVSGYYDCSLAGTTGVHDVEGVIKHLMAGADVVQVCSLIYNTNYASVVKLLDELNSWLDSRGIETVDAIRGVVSHKNSSTPDNYERTQYVEAFTKQLR